VLVPGRPLSSRAARERTATWNSFDGKLRDELLNAAVFNTLLEAQVLIEQWRVHYNTVRPHSSLGYRPPAPEVIVLGVAMLPSNPGSTGSNQPPAWTTQWGLDIPVDPGIPRWDWLPGWLVVVVKEHNE
jgi:hypothetical protein